MKETAQNFGFFKTVFRFSLPCQNFVTHRIYLSKSLVPNVGAQVVLPVVPGAAGRTRPQPGLGVLAVDVTLQALLVVKGLLAGLEKICFFNPAQWFFCFVFCFFYIYLPRREFF
jgi:hypothetical protein